MSFAKAKRFLEKIPIGPSPTEYNVSTASKLPGAVIPKSDRFIDPKSPCVSSENGGSTKSVPCFRTPILPKKKKLILPSPGINSKVNELFAEKDLQDEELQEKIVECRNKDQFIQDLSDQMEELQETLGHFKIEKQALNAEITAMQNRKTQIEEDHQTHLHNLQKDHQHRVQELQDGINIANEQITSIKEQYAVIKAEKKMELQQLLENIDSFQVLYKNMCDAFNKELQLKKTAIQNKESDIFYLEQQLIDQQRNHAKEIQKLSQERQAEVQDIEYEMLKTLTEMQNNVEDEKRNCKNKLAKLEAQLKKQIEDNKREYECDKRRIVQENDARIAQLEENGRDAVVLVEIQMQEKMRDLEISWAMKLDGQKQESQAILKECEEISVYNIIQCELEKNKALEDLTVKSAELSTLTKQIESFENNNVDCQKLIEECKAHKEENAANLITLAAKTAEFERLSKELAVDKKTFNITIRNSHDAITVLKKRLINSDHDVVQLKVELETCESDKLQLEQQCSTLRDELTEAQALNNNFEADIKNRIKEMESSFVVKIEAYKCTVDESITAYMAKIEQQHALLVSLKQQHDKQEGINAVTLQLNQKYQEDYSQLEHTTAENVCTIAGLELSNKTLLATVETLEKKNKELDDREDIENLKRQLFQVQEKSDTYFSYLEYYKTKAAEYEEELVEVADIRKKYIEKSGIYDQLLQKYDELRNTVSEQNALIDPFRKQLEEYERENSELLNQVGETENHAKDMALKCAKLLGHQNHKQKIQHLISLKNKNDELQQSLKEARAKEKSQYKLIEKLRETLDSIKKTKMNVLNVADKENVPSPNRTLNNSRGVDASPVPLRDRN